MGRILPYLYIYTVNNPMEGVIAKRRGYATLVDHMIVSILRNDGDRPSIRRKLIETMEMEINAERY